MLGPSVGSRSRPPSRAAGRLARRRRPGRSARRSGAASRPWPRCGSLLQHRIRALLSRACVNMLSVRLDTHRVLQYGGGILQDDLITARGLTKVYDTFTAVDGIDFTVPRGEAFGFLGPNGA